DLNKSKFALAEQCQLWQYLSTTNGTLQSNCAAQLNVLIFISLDPFANSLLGHFICVKFVAFFLKINKGPMVLDHAQIAKKLYFRNNHLILFAKNRAIELHTVP